TLAEYLRHYVDKNLNNWDHLLPYVFFVYNSTVHTSTNFQPYALSMQVSYKLAREKLIEHKIKSKGRYDKNENLVDIHVKDLVLLKDNAYKNKLNSLWLGPYEVIVVIGDENIIMQRGRRGITVHKNNIIRSIIIKIGDDGWTTVLMK
ncbi:zinc finger BED domain-containing protein 1-like, partial [Aphis craccivora]